MELRSDERARALELQQLKGIIESTRSLESRVFSAVEPRSFVRASPAASVAVDALSGSGNDLVDKCVLTFSRMALEVDHLTNEARDRMFNALLLYGEAGETEDVNAICMTSSFFPFLHDLALYVMRVTETASLVLNQLFRLFTSENKILVKAMERPMWRGWRLLGDCLVLLLTIDEIVKHRTILTEHFENYSKSIELVSMNPAQVGLAGSEEKMKLFVDLIRFVEQTLFAEPTLQSCCRQCHVDEFASNKPFLERFRTIISDSLHKWDQVSQQDIPDRHRLMVLCSLTALYSNLAANQVDKKLVRQLCATQKRIVAFHLVGEILFVPTLFLQQALPKQVVQHMDKTCSKQSLEEAMKLMLSQQADQLPKESQLAGEIVQEWKMEMRNVVPDSTTASGNGTANQLAVLRLNTLLKVSCWGPVYRGLKGARLADRVDRLIKCVLNAHLADDRPISKSNAFHLFKLVHIVQSISQTLDYHWPSVLEWVQQAAQFWSRAAVSILEAVRQNMTSSSPYNLDVISALHLASLHLSNSTSKDSLINVGFSLEIAHYLKHFRSSEIQEMDSILGRLDSVSSIGNILKRVTDCSFIFWHRILARICFQSLWINDLQMEAVTVGGPQDNLKVGQSLFRALDDATDLLKSARHIEPHKLISAYRTEVFALFESELVDPLCTEIENDLRVFVHSRQNVDENLLEEELFRAKVCRRLPNMAGNERYQRTCALLALPSVRLGGQELNVREAVTVSLQKIFYDLTAVALHDSETYAHMRLQAKRRYGLVLMDSHLPYMSIDQGLDILQIASTFEMFVKNFTYDLQEQAFYEKDSSTKMLHVVRVKNLVKSMKTRGLGVVNNTLNEAYKLLKSNMRAFSKFLFNEQIRSQLSKDVRFYRDSIDELKEMYPVRRAEKFNNSITKLGFSASGKGLLDEFKELITQIGNALGFVQMIRSAVLEVNAYTAEFAGLYCEKEAYEQETVKQGPIRTFERALDASLAPFHSNNDYVQMLLRVFAKELRDHERFGHLRTFFIIIPPLTINFVDHLSQSRARLQRGQTGSEAIFVDDGFSMGVAFLLSVLNQDYFFDSLNWFKSVDRSLRVSLDATQRETNAQKNKDQSFALTLSIRSSRLNELATEFQYLSYTLGSARMLFSAPEVSETCDNHFIEDI